jgi:CubicO group peptidase (beta-lactamase class C family)
VPAGGIDPADAGMDAARLNEAVGLVRARGARAQLVVLRHGRVVLDRSFGCRPDARFWIFSASKPLVAVVLHRLAERGELDLDAPVAAVWPGFGAHGKEAVTTRQVLRHRAGFGVGAGLLGDAAVLHDWDRTIARVERMRLRWAPGEVPAYSPLLSGFVLGEVVRRATGRGVRELLEELVLAPLGLASTSLGLPDDQARYAVPVHGGSPLGIAVAAVVNRPAVRRAVIPSAGIATTARDLARFYLALLRGGELDGARILQEATLAAALLPTSDDEVDRVARWPIRWTEGFQLGGPRSVRGTVSPMGASSSEVAFGHNGSNCCIGWADPERDLVLAYLTDRVTWPLPDLRHHAAVADRVLAAVRP